MPQVLVKSGDGHRWVDSESAQAKKQREKNRIEYHTSTYTDVKPRTSNAVACHPSQVEEFNAEVKAAGLSASIAYLPDGTLHATSKSAFKEELKRRGLYDYNE